jgi:ABC-type transport system substrate-binding protein
MKLRLFNKFQKMKSMKKISLILLLILLAVFILPWFRHPISIPNNITKLTPDRSQANTVIFGTKSGPQDLDPMDTWDSASSNVQDQVCEGLFRYNLADPELAIIPALATDYGIWDFSGSKPVYKIILRQDVWFHDNTKFDATAAKWNLDRYANLMDLGLAKAAELYEYYDPDTEDFINIIDSVTITGAYSLNITCNVPYGLIEAILSFNAMYMLSPTSTPFDEVLDTATGDLVGTGPFVYDGYEAGVEVTFHAWDYYYKPRAKIDILIFSVINDAQERNNALLNEQIDLINDPLQSMYEIFDNDPDIYLYCDSKPLLNIHYLGMNSYWINTTFRKAISYAINYSFIIRELLLSQAIRLKSPIPNGINYANDGFDYAEFNLTEARAIMQSMGYGVGYTTDVQWTEHAYSLNGKTPFMTWNYTYNIGNWMHECMMFVLTDNLAKIGIAVEDAGGTWANLIYSLYELAGRFRDQVPLYWLEWNAYYNDPSYYINMLFTNRTIASNGAKYNGYLSAIEAGRNPFDLNDNVQLLMEMALLETNTVTRKGYYDRIQQLLVEEDMPFAWGYTEINYVAYHSRISGYQENAMEKVWFYNVIVLFEIDRQSPVITVNSPTLETLYAFNSPSFDITIDEENLDSSWYTLYNGTNWSENVLFSGLTGIIEQTLWNAFGNGTILIRFYANDTSGREGYSEVLVYKDILEPLITITSPLLGEIFNQTSPTFDLTITEANIDKIWYTLDSGGTNYTILGTSGTIYQTLWDSFGAGAITIRFYANDTLGNIGTAYTIVIKSTPQIQPSPSIPGANSLVILFLFLGVVLTILWENKRKDFKGNI